MQRDPMVIRTIGDIRKLIDGRPDEMEVNFEILDLDELSESSRLWGLNLNASFETRCDDSEHLYLSPEVEG